MSTITESIDVKVTVPAAYNQWTQVKGDMARFKTFIENRDGHETGAWRGDVDRPAQH